MKKSSPWPLVAVVPGEITVLKFMMLGAVFYGTVRTADLAWALGDMGVGLMAWLNIIGILILFLMGKPALKALRDYRRAWLPRDLVARLSDDQVRELIITQLDKQAVAQEQDGDPMVYVGQLREGLNVDILG